MNLPRTINRPLLDFNGTDAVITPIIDKAPGSEGIVFCSGKGLAFAFIVDVLIDGYLADALPDDHAGNLVIPGGTAEFGCV